MANLANKNAITMHDVTSVEELKQLLFAGGNVNKKNIFEETPLLAALRRNIKLKLIEEFLKNGADVNTKDVWGVSPLYCAVARHSENLTLIKLLLDNGADIKSGKPANDRFLDRIMTHKHFCAQLLIKYKFLKNSSLLNDLRDPLNRDYYSFYKKIVDLDLKMSSYAFLGNFLDGCAAEVLRMRCFVINNGMSLLEFVSKSSPDAVNDLISMQIIAKRVYEALSTNDYPLFKDIILSKIGREAIMNLINAQLWKTSFKEGYFFNFENMSCISEYLPIEHLLKVAVALSC